MVDDKETIEQSYKTWLTQKVPSARLSELYRCYPKIEQYCIKIKVLRKPLFATTDLDTVKNAQKAIMENRLFQLLHKKQMRVMVSAAQYYTAFIKEYSAKQVETPRTGDPIAHSDSVCTRDGYETLLKDSRFDLLREALLNNGISTISELKQVNLWSFMNSHRLYSIHERLTISTELTTALNAVGKRSSEAAVTKVTVKCADGFKKHHRM